MSKKLIEKDKFKIAVDDEATERLKKSIWKIIIFGIVGSMIITPIYLKLIDYQGDTFLCTMFAGLAMCVGTMLLIIIVAMILSVGDEGFSESQAVYIIKSIKKGFVGVVEEIGNYYPDTWTQKWGYGLFVNGASHLVDKNCLSCFNTFVERRDVVACLCKTCGGPLFYSHDFVFFKCHRCGNEVKITNELHPKYEEGESTNLIIPAKELMRKVKKVIKKCNKQE